MVCSILLGLLAAASIVQDVESKAPPIALDQLPGAELLETEGDLAAAMVAGLREYLLSRIEASVATREELWPAEAASAAEYLSAVAPMRARLRKLIGAVDPRAPLSELELCATTERSSLVARGEGFEVHEVRWAVFEDVRAEGLLLEPAGDVRANVVALPDADWEPETIAGIGEPRIELHYARRLAAAGCRVVIPVLVSRDSRFAGNPAVGMTAQSNREWIYRQAYELGRHVIGYEVQVVHSLVDWFDGTSEGSHPPIGVIGYGEGGLVAFYAAALDERIDAAVVSGYLEGREKMWREPIYRNVFSFLKELGDAGVAGLIAPRRLIIEASAGPSAASSGPTPGSIEPPPFDSTLSEVKKARTRYRAAGAEANLQLIGDGSGPPGRGETLNAFLTALGADQLPALALGALESLGADRDRRARLGRVIQGYQAHTQRLMRQSEHRRNADWAAIDHSSLEAYQRTLEPFRERFRKELIGELPAPDVPLSPRARIYTSTERWTAFEVVLDVWPGVFAYGILCVPHDITASEKRPVIVCQHGLEGRSQDVVEPLRETWAYRSFGARLADRGYVVFAPQNPYIGGDGFRVLQRMANPIGATLFSTIVRQHERILEWLGSLPFVDAGRIAFYGLSYGGKTAMRVPALLEGYCLSICSADFNEWLVKNVTVDWSYSYLFTGEYDMYEFDLGHIASYAEMAALIAPRPFMVERGHHDGVAPDEWVAYEYAKVRRRYAKLKIGERTAIEFFDGPHEIHGVGTFEFLDRHLRK